MQAALKLFALAVLSAVGWGCLLKKSQAQGAATSSAKTEAMQTWEGEGGGLPDGGPGQTTATPP